MKLLCETNVVRRANREAKGRFYKSTLAVGKKNEKSNLCLILITTSNKSGTKYGRSLRLRHLITNSPYRSLISDLTNNIANIFLKFVGDGKCTISLKLPELDIQIKAETIQLKAFLNVMKTELSPPDPNKDVTKTDNKLIRAFGTTSKMMEQPIYKLSITQRADIPSKGFARTLKQLHINGVGYSQMPIGILNLTNLAFLDLSNNSITKLPKALGNLRLNQLLVHQNQLGDSTLKRDWDWLNGDNIRKSLQVLNMSQNKLKCMPVDIAWCERLINLDMSHNEIGRIPFAIKQMKFIKHINFGNNQLSSLPASITKLNLDVIDITNNKFPVELMPTNDVLENHQRLSNFELRPPLLFEISARAVMKHNIPFMNVNIPRIIKEILFYSPDCVKCESLCFDVPIFEKIHLIKLNSKQRVTSNNGHYFVADGPFCSRKCLQKIQKSNFGRVL